MKMTPIRINKEPILFLMAVFLFRSTGNLPIPLICRLGIQGRQAQSSLYGRIPLRKFKTEFLLNTSIRLVLKPCN